MQWLEVETERQTLASLLRLVSASAANSQGRGHALPLTTNLIPGPRERRWPCFHRAPEMESAQCAGRQARPPHVGVHTHTHTPVSKVAPCAS